MILLPLPTQNPFLSPYWEFQRFKTHPAVRRVLENGSVIQYGARTLNEGGLQAIPQLTFPGGALIGCSAGFLNVSKIKGTHTAMKSGMLAAESAFEELAARASNSEDSDSQDTQAQAVVTLHGYPEALKQSWVYDELHKSRNLRPGFQRGFVMGMINAAIDTYIFGGRAPYTLRQTHPDNEALAPVSDGRHSKPIDYPKPDGKLTFDIPTSLYRSGTNHDHDQPAHLRLRDQNVPNDVNYPVYGGPEGRYCPARVYEYVDVDDSADGPDPTDRADDCSNPKKTLVINAQNCLHCKACDIKGS